MYEIKFHRRVAKDIGRLKAAKLGEKAKRLIEIVKINPFQNPPPYEKLVGNLHGLYSRRINAQHRMVYDVSEQKKQVRVLSMWTHYENI